MLEVDLQASGELEEGYAAGPAVSLGFMFDPVPGLGLGVNARGVEFMYGEKERGVSLSMTGQIIISRNLKAQLNVNRTMLDEREVSNASFRIMLSYNYN